MHARTHARTHAHTHTLLSVCYILVLLTPCILCTLLFMVPIKSKDVTCLCKLTCLSLSLSPSERKWLLPHLPKGSLIGCSTVSTCCCVLPQGLVFPVPPGPGGLCHGAAGAVTGHPVPGTDPAPGQRDAPRPGSPAASDVWVLVSPTVHRPWCEAHCLIQNCIKAGVGYSFF